MCACQAVAYRFDLSRDYENLETFEISINKSIKLYN